MKVIGINVQKFTMPEHLLSTGCGAMIVKVHVLQVKVYFQFTNLLQKGHHVQLHTDGEGLCPRQFLDMILEHHQIQITSV